MTKRSKPAQPGLPQLWPDSPAATPAPADIASLEPQPQAVADSPAPRRQPPPVVYTEEERIAKYIRPTKQVWYPHLSDSSPLS